MDPVARLLPDGKRLHLQHGPSDLIVMAEGQRDLAYSAAVRRFETVIEELVAELPALRTMISPVTTRPQGTVSGRMHDAAIPFAANGYLTRMAAVAGAIADEILQTMCEAADLSRAYVNNGGDIALHLAPEEVFQTAIRSYDSADLGRVEIRAEDPVRGIATSGRHGRSLSMGIADSVTVLAPTAAQADVAATLIANAVDLPGHPAITRRPAHEIADDSDLGGLPVVVGCDALPASDCETALANGCDRAAQFQGQNLICGAGLFLQGCAVATADRILTLSQEAIYA